MGIECFGVYISQVFLDRLIELAKENKGQQVRDLFAHASDVGVTMTDANCAELIKNKHFDDLSWVFSQFKRLDISLSEHQFAHLIHRYNAQDFKPLFEFVVNFWPQADAQKEIICHLFAHARQIRRLVNCLMPEGEGIRPEEATVQQIINEHCGSQPFVFSMQHSIAEEGPGYQSNLSILGRTLAS